MFVYKAAAREQWNGGKAPRQGSKEEVKNKKEGKGEKRAKGLAADPFSSELAAFRITDTSF